MLAYSMSVRFLGEGFGPRYSLRKIVRVRQQAANHGLYTKDRKVGSGDQIGVHHLSASPATEPCVANRMLSIAVTPEKTSVLLTDLAIKVCRVYRNLQVVASGLNLSNEISASTMAAESIPSSVSITGRLSPLVCTATVGRTIEDTPALIGSVRLLPRLRKKVRRSQSGS
jgi:hypothetical protein